MNTSRLKVITGGLLFLASLPTLIVVLSSFNAGDAPQFPPSGWSFHGYGDLVSDDVIRQALTRSLMVGLYSVVISLPIGLAASFALYRYKVRMRGAVTGYLLLGFSTPLVVSGMAFLVLYYQIGQIGSLFSTSIAVVTVNFPFMLLALGSSIDLLNPELEEAAGTLGAEKVQTFLLVTLPSVMPGVLMGSVLMFIFGTTEFLVSLILSTTANQTLPVVLFSGLRSSLQVRHAAAGGLYIAIALIVVFLMTQVRLLDQFLYRKE